ATSTTHNVARSAGGAFEFSSPDATTGAANYVVASDPSPGGSCNAFAGDSLGKVFKNTSCATFNWAQVGTTLTGGVLSLAAHPTNGVTLLAGTSTGNIYRKADAAAAWTVVSTVNAGVR